MWTCFRVTVVVGVCGTRDEIRVEAVVVARGDRRVVRVVRREEGGDVVDGECAREDGGAFRGRVDKDFEGWDFRFPGRACVDVVLVCLALSDATQPLLVFGGGTFMVRDRDDRDR